jgi:REP element-mobilizing transposase RayT
MDLLAYHLTWTTYGTWLHGDARGWVASRVPGIQEPDPERESTARGRMAEAAVVLTPAQREVVERTVREHCRIRGWVIHALNVRSNHVHVVVTAGSRGEEVMHQFKAWAARMLSDAAGLSGVVARKAGRRRWWTEHGSVKLIRDHAYLDNAIQYVMESQ